MSPALQADSLPSEPRGRHCGMQGIQSSLQHVESLVVAFELLVA